MSIQKSKSKMVFPAGKLPPQILRRLLGQYLPGDRRVLIGPRFGEDAAVIAMGRNYLVAKSDPITFTADRLGWYAVNINANDIAVMGARPRWFLSVMLLPEKKTDRQLVESIFKDVQAACRRLSITVCGGHTEITAGLNRPLLIGHLLGEVAKKDLVLKSRLRAGDAILLTKGIALEGSAILAREKAAKLKKYFRAAWLKRVGNFIYKPGISVVPEALAAAQAARQTGGVHAMHDPTEGGLTGGLLELAAAGNVGLRVHAERIPVLPETRALAERLKFDPMALIASGSLLIAVAPREADKVIRALKRRKIAVAHIGEAVGKSAGVKIVERGSARRLCYPNQDEIARLI